MLHTWNEPYHSDIDGINYLKVYQWSKLSFNLCRYHFKCMPLYLHNLHLHISAYRASSKLRHKLCSSFIQILEGKVQHAACAFHSIFQFTAYTQQCLEYSKIVSEMHLTMWKYGRCEWWWETRDHSMTKLWRNFNEVQNKSVSLQENNRATLLYNIDFSANMAYGQTTRF